MKFLRFALSYGLVKSNGTRRGNNRAHSTRTSTTNGTQIYEPRNLFHWSMILLSVLKSTIKPCLTCAHGACIRIVKAVECRSIFYIRARVAETSLESDRRSAARRVTHAR